MIRYARVVFLLLSSSSGAQITLHPTDNVPQIVSSHPAGTTFVFAPCTYRLSQTIIPRTTTSLSARLPALRQPPVRPLLVEKS